MSSQVDFGQLLIEGVRLNNFGVFQRGLDGGGDVNVMVTEADPAVNGAPPYSLLVCVLARKELNKEIYEAMMRKNLNVCVGSMKNYTPLMAAAQYNHNEVFDQLLALGADVHSVHSGLNANACYFATMGGNLTVLQRLVTEFGLDPTQVNVVGETLVLTAALYNHNGIVKYIVENYGADPDKPNGVGFTPFMAACQAGNLELARYLFEACKVNPKRVILNGSSCALCIASENGHLGVVKYLLEICKVGNVNEIYMNGFTAFSVAAYRGHAAVVEYLLKDGNADVDIMNTDQSNAFTEASREGHLAVVRLLCESETAANLNCKYKNRVTGLYLARLNKHNHVVQYLTENIGQCVMEKNLSKVTEILAADPNLNISVPLPVRSLINGEYRDFECRLPFEIAIEGQSQPLINALWPRVNFSASADYTKMYLLRAISATDLPTVKRLFAIHPIGFLKTSIVLKAAVAGSADIFKYLLEEQGLQIKSTNEESAEDWLIAAATGGSLVIFEQVFAAVGGDYKVRLNSGESLLHLACRAGSVELATFLIAEKLDVNDDQNTSKESPICCAVCSGSLALVKYLIAVGANASIIVSEHSSTFPGASLLHLAARCNSREILMWFLSRDCETRIDPKLRDGAGWMLVHHAAQTGNVDCLRSLRDSGFDIDDPVEVINNRTLGGGYSALMIASLFSIEDTVAFLLGCGAEINYQCVQGHPALYYAIPQQNQHIHPLDCFAPERYQRAMNVVKLLLAKEDVNPNLRVDDNRWDTWPLDQALWLQHFGIAQLLIEDPRVDVNSGSSKTGYTFVYAIELEMTDIARLLLSRCDLMVNQQNSAGEIPLVVAQRKKLAELALEIKVHPKFEEEHRLFGYVRENRLAEVRACLESDPDLIELKLENGETPLLVACSCCSVEMIKLIVLSWQGRVRHWLNSGDYDLIRKKITSRWHVSFGGAMSTVVSSPAEVDAVFDATAYSGPEAVHDQLQVYLRRCAQVFDVRKEHFTLAAAQYTALAYLSLIKANRGVNFEACHKHLQQTLEMLYFNEKYKSGNFPLFEISVFGVNADCVECVEYMLTLESVLVNLESPCGDGPALVWISEKANALWADRILRIFLSSPRVDVNKHCRRIQWDGHSALTKALETSATFEHALTIVKLRPDVDINYRIADHFGGCSALTLASGANCLELMKLMLTFPSVNVNVVDANGLTPLIHASMNLRHVMMEVLVTDPRVDVDVAIINRSQNIYPAGCTALHCAAHGNEMRCLEHLYQRPNLNTEPRTAIEKWTPLMFAALKGFAESVKWLVAHGADVLAVDNDGMTARLLALQCGRIRIAGILLEKEQELEMTDSQKHQDELTARIEAFDLRQNELELVQAAWAKNISSDIEELKARSILHTEQLRVLYRERELLLSEKLVAQQLSEAVKYIMARPLLKAFYNHLQSKLTELFLAYKSLASGALSRAQTTTDTMAGYAINLAGGMIPYVGDVVTMAAELIYEAVRDGREDAIFSSVSSIIVSMDEMLLLVKSAARLTLYKLESQLEKLDGNGEAKGLAECVVGYYLAGLRSKAIELKENASVYEQLSLCLFKYEPAGMFAYLNETVLKTHPSYDLPKWTARGSLKESGIATSDGVCLAHPKASVKTYGYRFGSVEEAVQLGYVESSTRVDPAHPLRENPFRYKELVDIPEIPPVLTWALLLTSAKNFPDMAICIKGLDTCEDNGSDVIVVFKPEVTRRQLMSLVGYLSKQSNQVVDRSIGPVISCTAAKGSTTIVMRTDSEASAELLSMEILELWRP